MRERVKRHRGCRCRPRAILDAGAYEDYCHWRNCVEFRCLECHGFLGGWGPVWCPCDGGAPREFKHQGMRNPTARWDPATETVIVSRVAVKPSKARRFQGGKHGR